MTDLLTKEYLEGMSNVESVLASMSFRKHSFEKKGFAFFSEYERDTTRVKFLFGPPDWDVEMIVYTSRRKFSFDDLLAEPEIREWFSEHRFSQSGERHIKDELNWDLELLKFSLPIIE